ncbi:class I SAM-dependent methyltransferase [Spirosoma sp. BT702]|uniref:Class I SAM-dependent methyltransferase n=1 Tax=Spirosoma profusum TaxID=2771354 RepID=A0A926XUG2_9BACT|nr:class I SAM-dependent methyltransferase [Spirosoma profusum]MBD2700628.1 class I SAM-dependent methyltransferase [Spirosoma profusum]
MIGRSEEYEKMFKLEGQLWWYRNLHERVVEALEKRFGQRRDIAILDAGCGTGGMLDFLRRKGYKNLRGIDGSADAVAFCQERGFSVALLDMNQLPYFEVDIQYDAIVCNDVFCYFNDAQLTNILSAMAHLLRTDGILISNNNAFDLFWGEHDLAVKSTRRFTLATFERLLPMVGLRITWSTYWSFILSFLILPIRQWQQLQLKLGWRNADNPESDVYLPNFLVNQTLYRIARTEQKLFRRTPFGSSLFLIVELSDE